ncbi:UDP-N-acetylmuramoyl-L-alanine--D-glutamate ligase, partial [Francisella tularensis subsp. holarctica]|nr:UDP-N-acetylmuramoyl-L-alanine--D-glutamate ligase [Francisella tularensis subsp. holarctica]
YYLITVSPVITLNKSPYRALTKFKDKIVSDIYIFYQYIKDTKAKTIAVTGSNGISTLVTMTDFVLKDLGYKSILVG